jgi:hypothetical protein
VPIIGFLIRRVVMTKQWPRLAPLLLPHTACLRGVAGLRGVRSRALRASSGHVHGSVKGVGPLPDLVHADWIGLVRSRNQFPSAANEP